MNPVQSGSSKRMKYMNLVQSGSMHLIPVQSGLYHNRNRTGTELDMNQNRTVTDLHSRDFWVVYRAGLWFTGLPDEGGRKPWPPGAGLGQPKPWAGGAGLAQP